MWKNQPPKNEPPKTLLFGELIRNLAMLKQPPYQPTKKDKIHLSKMKGKQEKRMPCQLSI